jgi:hypothetical protein
MPGCQKEKGQPYKKEAAVNGIAAGKPFSKEAERGFFLPRRGPDHPFHAEKPAFRQFGKPFVPIRDVAFGGEVADEKYFPVFRKIIAGGADDNLVRVVFDQDMIVQIWDV